MIKWALPILQVVFIICKVFNLLNWSWSIVFIPSYIWLTVFFIFLVFCLIYIFGGQKMKCPYKDNRFENTTSKYIYDEDGSLIENKITTCTASTFGKCDGEECAAYKDGVCQYVLVEKGG